MKLFEDITNYGKNFVQGNRGVWDHKRWEQLLTDIQKKGVTMTEEAVNSIGQMLESFKKVLTSSSMDLHKFDEVAESSKEFVMKRKGKWNHDLWLGFLDDLQKKGIPRIEEIADSIGWVLESLRKIYFLSPQLKTPTESQEMKASELSLQKEDKPLDLQKDQQKPKQGIAEERGSDDKKTVQKITEKESVTIEKEAAKKHGAQIMKKQEDSVVVKLEIPPAEKPLPPVAAKISQQPMIEKQRTASVKDIRPFPRLKKKRRQKAGKTSMLKRKKVSEKNLKKRIRLK